VTFEEYVATRAPSLLRLAGVLAGDRHLAEDVVQEALVRAGQRWEHIEALGAPDAYVRRMVVNEYLSWRRKWSRQVSRPEVALDRTVPDPADRIVQRDDLAERIGRLPARQRAAIVLRFYDDLPNAAIADVLGCSVGTVRSHISHALSALRIDIASERLNPAGKDG